VATEDLDPHNGSLLYQDIDVDIETPCSATNNVEMSGFGCRASDLATARKLEFKNLLPPTIGDQSPASEDLHSPLTITEPTIRHNAKSNRQDGGKSEVKSFNKDDMFCGQDEDLDSDISDSADELDNSDQVS
jgi:hypothetical protein